MKSCQLFRLYKRFRKKKHTHTVVNENTKTEKSWNLFYNRLFYKVLQPFKKIIIFSAISIFVHKIFIFSQARSQRSFRFLIRG